MIQRTGRTAALAIAVASLAFAGPAAAMCNGDCNNDGEVNISELTMGVNIFLGRAQTDACSNLDASPNDRRITVNELVLGTISALDGCPINLTAKTFRSVQQLFDQSCAFSSCHSALTRAGGLVLASEDVSYTNLVDADPQNAQALAMGLKLVDSGDPANSYLLRKLRGTGPGASMPLGTELFSEEVVQVIEDWITRGAHETLEECAALGDGGDFGGTGAHPGDVTTVCDDAPIEPGDFVWEPEEPLPAPAPGEGVQFYVPPRPVEAGTEWESCFAFRADWQALGREAGLDGANPVFRQQDYRMHSGSHHLLVYSYFGDYPDWEWPEGHFECSAGNCVHPGICTDGTCSSGKVGNACTTDDECSECPPDGRQILTIGGTQVAGTRYQVVYPDGVGIPVLDANSVIIANLHYTNPFQPSQDIYAEAWLNFYFYKKGEWKALLDGVFAIGFNDLLVEPYESRTMTEIWQPTGGLISGPDDANIFNLFGHMHKRGILFQVDLISGGECSATGELCAKDSDCRCRPRDRNCTEGQTCIIGPNHEDTTIYSTTSWGDAPVIDYPPPYLKVPLSSGLRWTCVHQNGREGDPDFPPKVCHEGCRACGWDADSRTCIFTRGRQLGFYDSNRVYEEGEPMPLVFGELADDDMCNLFGYYIPQTGLENLQNSN